MTKRKGPPPGRGQEEFTGDFAAALGAMQHESRRIREALWGDRQGGRRYKAKERYSHHWERPGGGRGPMRPFAVGWRVKEGPDVAAMGRTVMIGSSAGAIRTLAAAHCCREARRRISRLGEGFEIRYIKELK